MKGRHTDGNKHGTRHNGRWEDEPSLVFYCKERGCSRKLCHKLDPKNQQSQQKVWNAEACTTPCKDVLSQAHGIHYAQCSSCARLCVQRCPSSWRHEGGDTMAGGASKECSGRYDVMPVLSVQVRDCTLTLPATLYMNEPLLSLTTILVCTTLSASNLCANAPYTQKRVVQ